MGMKTSSGVEDAKSNLLLKKYNENYSTTFIPSYIGGVLSNNI